MPSDFLFQRKPAPPPVEKPKLEGPKTCSGARLLHGIRHAVENTKECAAGCGAEDIGGPLTTSELDYSARMVGRTWPPREQRR